MKITGVGNWGGYRERKRLPLKERAEGEGRVELGTGRQNTDAIGHCQETLWRPEQKRASAKNQ